MGKHDASRHARKPEKKSPKTLLWVILAVVLVAAVAAALFFAGAFRPAEEEMARTPEATEEPAAEEDIRLPGTVETEEEMPVLAVEEREEISGEEVEEIQIAGDVDPADEVASQSGQTMPAEEILAGGEAGEAAEAVLRLEPGDGQTHHVYIQQNPGGMAMVEYLVQGDVIVSSAESVYASVAGMDDMTVEGLAQGFTMTSRPEEYTDSVELLWERQGDWLIMVTVLEGLDDPAKLEAYGDYGLMRIVNDDSYTLAAAEEFLFGLGYEKQ